MQFDAIFEWKMSSLETETYKLALIYEREFYKIFGGTGQDFKRNTIPKSGDPRKSELFRHCWKLRRETVGLLTPSQYESYIKANLTVLKINKAYISPNSICGDKAWIRWKVWERWYNQKLGDRSAVKSIPSVATTDPKIIREIDRTKRFLFEKSEGEPTRDKLRKFVEDSVFKLWVMSGKVSIYYVVMSPYVSGYVEKLSLECLFDPSVYRENITSEVERYFHHEFIFEFERISATD